jgi:uncharacterized membrane protein YgcG
VPSEALEASVERGEAQQLVDLARDISGLAFALHVGEFTDGQAQAMLGDVTDPDGTILVAVDPDHRIMEIVTGSYAMSRVNDQACQFALLAMQSNFASGDLAAGIRNGIMLLAEHARAPEVLHLDEPS